MFFGFQLTCGMMLLYYGYTVMKNPRVWGDQGRRSDYGDTAWEILPEIVCEERQRRVRGFG